MLTDSTKRSASRQVTRKFIILLTDRVTARAAKHFARYEFFYGQLLLAHHSIRQDGKLHTASSTGCSVSFELHFAADAGAAQLV
jgi:hypothetical protein